MRQLMKRKPAQTDTSPIAPVTPVTGYRVWDILPRIFPMVAMVANTHDGGRALD
jgi:hypothetical protein